MTACYNLLTVPLKAANSYIIKRMDTIPQYPSMVFLHASLTRYACLNELMD